MNREHRSSPDDTAILPPAETVVGLRKIMEDRGSVWIRRNSGEFVQGRIIDVSEDGAEISLSFPAPDRSTGMGKKRVKTTEYLAWQKDPNNPNNQPIN